MATAPYLNYARTLFGGTSVPGVGTDAAQSKPRPDRQYGTGAAPQTFAEMQAAGQARPAPPPASAPASPAPASAPAVPDWLAGALGAPSAMMVDGAPPPTVAPPPAPTGTGALPGGLPPTASAPNTPPPTAVAVGQSPGGFGAPGAPASPDGTPVQMTAFDPNTIQSRAMLGLPTTPYTSRDDIMHVWEGLPNGTARQMFASTLTPAEMATLSTIDRLRVSTQMGDAGIEQYLRQAGAAGASATGAPSAPSAGGVAGVPPGDDLATAYAMKFQRGAEDLDDQFAQRETGITEDMARRGLADSSIRGGRLQDLNVAHRSASSDLLSQIAAELGTSAYQRALGNRSLDLQTELGRGQLTLAQQAQRDQVAQFAQQMGLSRDQFDEMMREFDTTTANGQSNFTSQLWLALLPYLKDLLPAGITNQIPGASTTSPGVTLTPGS